MTFIEQLQKELEHLLVRAANLVEEAAHQFESGEVDSARAALAAATQARDSIDKFVSIVRAVIER